MCLIVKEIKEVVGPVAFQDNVNVSNERITVLDFFFLPIEGDTAPDITSQSCKRFSICSNGTVVQ